MSRDDSNDRSGNDTVAKLVHFQNSGERFEEFWCDVHEIVVEFARRNLRKVGVRVRADDSDGPVGDVVNETCGQLVSLSNPGAGGRFDPSKTKKPGMSGLRGWLWRVVRSRAVDWARMYRGDRGPKIHLVGDFEWNKPSQGYGDGSIFKDLAAKTQRADLLPILEACIRRLPDPQLREAVLIKLHESLAERPTAKKLGVPTTAVHRRLQKAYAILRPMLDDYPEIDLWLTP